MPSTKTKPPAKRPKTVQHVTSVPTPAWASISLPLLQQREGQWSVGYSIGCGDLLRAVSPIAGCYPSRAAAIGGACTLILDVLHRQLAILGTANGQDPNPAIGKERANISDPSRAAGSGRRRAGSGKTGAPCAGPAPRFYGTRPSVPDP